MVEIIAGLLAILSSLISLFAAIVSYKAVKEAKKPESEKEPE
jgi:hypothetical protein